MTEEKRIKVDFIRNNYTPECFSDWFISTFFPEPLFDAVLAGYEAGSLELIETKIRKIIND